MKRSVNPQAMDISDVEAACLHLGLTLNKAQLGRDKNGNMLQPPRYDVEVEVGNAWEVLDGPNRK